MWILFFVGLTSCPVGMPYGYVTAGSATVEMTQKDNQSYGNVKPKMTTSRVL